VMRRRAGLTKLLQQRGDRGQLGEFPVLFAAVNEGELLEQLRTMSEAQYQAHRCRLAAGEAARQQRWRLHRDPAGTVAALLQRYAARREALAATVLFEGSCKNPQYGLTLDTAFRALAVLLVDARLNALTITELNPDHGAEDGPTLADFADHLARALATAPTLR